MRSLAGMWYRSKQPICGPLWNFTDRNFGLDWLSCYPPGLDGLAVWSKWDKENSKPGDMGDVCFWRVVLHLSNIPGTFRHWGNLYVVYCFRGVHDHFFISFYARRATG